MDRRKELEISASLCEAIQDKLKEQYGDTPDQRIQDRVKAEWNAAEQSGSIVDIALLYELSSCLKEQRYPWCLRGCTGSSFLLYLLGIARGNPLPPHLYCPRCHTVLWQDCADGFDAKTVVCGVDQQMMMGDGHGIPWQSLWGYGELTPSFDIDLPESLYEPLQATLRADRFSQYDPEMEPTIQYPGRVKIIRLRKISMLFNLHTKPMDEHFYNHSYSGNDIQRMLCCWHDMIELEDWKQLAPPKDFGDLCALYGLLHSTGTWDDWTQEQIEHDGMKYAELVSDREFVFQYLNRHGFLEKDAWTGMRAVQMGHPLPVVTEEMEVAQDSWVIDRCAEVHYLFPKAHAVERILFNGKI